MESLHKCVPTQSCEGQLPSGHSLTYDNTKFVEILFGGDQLTVACANGIKALCGHDTAFDRLDGLVPVLEDWHVRVILLQVCVSCMNSILAKC